VEWGEGLLEFYPDAWFLNIDVQYSDNEDVVRIAELMHGESAIVLE